MPPIVADNMFSLNQKNFFKKGVDTYHVLCIIIVTVIIIKKKGERKVQHKFSRQRESIVENLKCRTDHPTADMVYSDIRQIYPNVSLGTVYRNLSLLANEKKIQKIFTDDGVLRFDYNVKPHDHFICRGCGSVSDLHITNTDELISSVSEKFSGQVDECVVTYYGLCENCLKSH